MVSIVTIILAFVKVDFLKPAHPFMLEAGPVVSKPEGGSVFRPRKNTG